MDEKLNPSAIENITWCVGHCEVLYRQLGQIQIRLTVLQRQYAEAIDLPATVAADKIAPLADEFKAISDKLTELAK